MKLDEEFKQEASELLTKFEDTLLDLETSPNDDELVDSAFRTLHSLKGAGMMFGWDDFAAFIHRVETILVRVRNGVLIVTPELVTLGLLVADHIRELLMRPGEIDLSRGEALLTAVAKQTTIESSNLTPTITNHHNITINNYTTPRLDDWAMISTPTNKERDSTIENSTLRVPTEKLNYLMNQITELVIVQERLSRVITNETNPLIKSIAEDFARLAVEIRDTTMTLRMLPISALFKRFRRVVHDLSRELGKKVEITMSGETTTIDKLLIDGLHDPLLHIIRNAIDHGIELPAQRVAAGKPTVGLLRFGASRSTEGVTITIEDDGRGLDYDAIRVKAENYGLIWPGQEISTNNLLNCVFYAGFSTAHEVTNISGRGVGMNVVKRAIDNLHGVIELKSEPGRGTTVILKLPKLKTDN
ncbi:hypothetical protein CCP3SC5AM1_840001 [Gammaproteobacteria bacterium]